MLGSYDFTTEQKQAIAHNKGHLRIIACAGSGKTEVVSRRVAQLIKNGVNPENIVAFTFTEKAADELKSRIRSILDAECPEHSDIGEMYVGTIHSFCFYMLKELEPKFRSYDVLDEAKRIAYISKTRNFNRMNLWPLKYEGKTRKLSKYSIINRFITSADIVTMEDINPDKLSNRHFKQAYLEYKKMLNEDRYFDFSTMISELVHILREDSKGLKNFNEKIKYLIVDEYQDVDRLQEELVRLVSLSANSVCVVGDDDQCIYQWRGSNIENIIDFDRRYKKYNVTDISLNMNFRSTEAIVETAKKFIQKNSGRLNKKSMTFNPKLQREFENGDIIHQHFRTEDDEFKFITDTIKSLEGTDFLDKNNNPFALSLGDFAVLVRNNDDAARIIPFFESRNIDCIAYSGTSVFDRPEVVFAMDCIGYIFDCPGYSTGYDNVPDQAYIFTEYGVIFNNAKFPHTNSGNFKKKITALKKEIFTIRKKKKDYLGDLGLQAVYHKILNAFGAEEFDFGDVYNYNLAVLSTAISDYESVWIRLRASEVKDFFEFIRAYGKGHYVEIQHQDNAQINAVKVLTIHKAKGLEFPVVFVPGLINPNKERTPTPLFVDEKLYDVARYNGTEEDERRVWYTAMTRSEKYLFLTGSAIRPTGKKPYGPHRFIEEIDRKYITNAIKLVRNKSGYTQKLNKEAIYPTSFSEITSYTDARMISN